MSLAGRRRYRTAAVAAALCVPAAMALGGGPARGVAPAPAQTVSPAPCRLDLSILPPDRRTTWRPGLPGGVPHVAAIQASIDAATYGDGSTDATAAINGALE